MMKTGIMNVIIMFLAAFLLYGTAVGQPPPIPAQEQPEVLTRGPVHEAFSEPVILQDQAGLVVPNEPPADIDEIPPEEMPQGDNYVWVPGYWSWDGDRDNYIWVSGCWRAAPPNMSWVPGYWSQESDGWQWVAGFWTPANFQDIEYLPAPPESYGEQPQNSPPSQDDIWVPSCQYWYQDHYIERPGYWLTANQDWVWVPSHYVWTPRGYIFSDGHWDYPLENRGVLFAPVYFPPSIYGRVNYRYSPIIVVDLGAMIANLFTYPRYSHYYFGDYYDDSYVSIGIFPRYEVDQVHTWYDPTYVYDRWQNRRQPRWEENQQHEYDLRHANKDLRPPRTYHDMEIRLASKSPDQQQNNFRMAEPLTVVAASKETPIKFVHVDTKVQQKIATQATAVRTYVADRNRWESKPVPQKAVQPPMDRKGSVTPVERKGPVTPPAEKNRPVTPVERKGSVMPPSEKNRSVLPVEPKGSMAPPSEPNKSVMPIKDKGPMTPPAMRKEQVTKPERVKVPAPPIVGKQGAAEKSPPPRPGNERNYAIKKNTPKNNQPADSTKVQGKGKNKGK